MLLQVKTQLEMALGRPQENPRVSDSTYTVGTSGNGRSLWEIAGEVYNDQYQWPRIYRANRTFIDRWFVRYKTSTGNGEILRPQDFLVPGWTLEIPR
jgi:nucleoid-associated protein YgaU